MSDSTNNQSTGNSTSDVANNESSLRSVASGSSRYRGNRYGRNYRKGNKYNNKIQPHFQKDFEGAISEIKGVLGTSNEEMELKQTFEEFKTTIAAYVSQNLTHGSDLAPLIFNNEDPVPKLTAPKVPTESQFKKPNIRIDYEKRYGMYLTRESTLQDNMKNLYHLVWGQCSPQLKSAIKGYNKYAEKSAELDSKWLLEHVVKGIGGVSSNGNKANILFSSIKRVFITTQYKNESTDDYQQRLLDAVDAVKMVGGKNFFRPEGLVEATGTDSNGNPETTEKDLERAEDEFLAMLFLSNTDSTRYRTMLKNLKDDSHLGHDSFPKTWRTAYHAINNHSTDYRGRRDSKQGDGVFVDVQFAQKKVVAGIDGRTLEDVLCYRCQNRGHYANQCPETNSSNRSTGSGNVSNISNESATGVGCMQKVVSFNQGAKGFVNKDWILLDTCSTSNTFCSPQYLKSIKQCKPGDELQLVSTGGITTFRQHGVFQLLPLRVHYNPKTMANVLSLKAVMDLPGVDVKLDSTKSDEIVVTVKNGGRPESSFVFTPCHDGLYYYNPKSKASNNEYSRFSFLSTVHSNQQHFTKSQIQRARRARLLQQFFGWPSTTAFKNYVSTNKIRNCDITVDDVNRAIYIFGEQVPLLQGKMTRSTPKTTQIHPLPLPLEILQHNNSLRMAMDIFFVNKLPFLLTKSRNVNFLSVQPLRTRTLSEIVSGLKAVKHKYLSRGFEITVWDGDNEFDRDKVKEVLAPAHTEICGKNDHVGFIERPIRTVKERSRCYCQALPYKYHTRVMTRGLVATTIHMLNSFPSEDGISKEMSPAGIVEGRMLPNANKKMIIFGAYALVYVQTSNDMKTRAIPAIAVQPSNNGDGHYFMSLQSGQKIHSSKWKELPINDEVVNRVESIAKKEGRPMLRNNEPLFEWEPGFEIDDDQDNQNEAVLDDDDDDEEYSDSDEEDISYDEESYVADEIDLEDIDNDVEMSFEEEQESPDFLQEELANEQIQNEGAYLENNGIMEEESTANDEEVQTQEREGTDRLDAEHNRTRPRRENAGTGVERLEMSFKGKSYKRRKVIARQHKQFLLKAIREMKEKECNSDIFEKHDLNKMIGITFAQAQMKHKDIPASKAFKVIGEKAIAAIVKEFKQLNDGAMPGKPVIGEVNPDKLTDEEKLKALSAVNLVKEKRNGIVKGRTCANGSKQRRYLKDFESVASPTVGLDALVLTTLIDATEGRDVATFDVPGAYLHANMPEDKRVLLRLDGQFVDIMCEVNPSFRKHVRTNEKGKKVLYLRVLRALYGCIESALLWYELFSITLIKLGFEINPYDRCIANKMINGKQCTIAWYVDDNKVSHEDPKVVTDIIEEIKKHFGDLKVNRGNIHDFLGMKIKINGNKTISLDMKDQINEALEMFGEKFEGPISSPATKLLQYVKEDSKQLDTDMSEKFHSVVAKLLYITKRARPDIEPTVAYLCTRVSRSDENDLNKLRRVLQFLKHTIEDVRTIGVEDGLKSLRTWVDASHAIYDDMKGQTGGCMSYGLGIIHGRSSKQKLNTKSTTESEVVGVSEYLPYNIWTINFMKAQGYDIQDNVMYQDNQSAMKMEINGRNSCTGNSRHIDIKFFFVKDRVDKKEIKIEYCPTEQMLADYFTKPLQGTLFVKMRNIIMGFNKVSDLSDIQNEERVENITKCEQNKTILNSSDKHVTRVNGHDTARDKSKCA